MSRAVTLPGTGTLIAATDVHGHLGDFRAVAARFLALAETGDMSPYLVMCGDLVHGPAMPLDQWPDYLGDYYRDETPQLLAEARLLQQRFPGRVHYLLGNHEHAHVGGPPVAKFHPDEAAALESCYRAGEFEPIRQWIAGWPLAVIAPDAGLVLTHAAPHAQVASAAELDALPIEGYETTPVQRMADSGPLGALLWARTTTATRAQRFLHAMHPQARVCVFGHDPIREGYLIEHEPLLCLSTSFGCHDGDKLYLEWNLSTAAGSAQHVAQAGLRALHPDTAPVFRCGPAGR